MNKYYNKINAIFTTLRRSDYWEPDRPESNRISFVLWSDYIELDNFIKLKDLFPNTLIFIADNGYEGGLFITIEGVNFDSDF